MFLPQPSPTGLESHSAPPGEFSPDERSLLLRLAHESILAALEQRKVSLDPPSPHLAEPRGVFTSLYLYGQLRGCVGYVLPKNSVYCMVAETACAAAFEDMRFRPVTLEEGQNLEIELSILSRPRPIAAEAIEIGRHGLLISMHGYRGLLLPQVPVEHNWDRETFLQQTCRKAGVPLDAWQKGAKLEAFTAEVFGEKAAKG
ncbi:MAG TPA: AmmeMemoRadiSam system protein A [Terriglobales bacterium]|jgi:AmmeMemoRadiSam system protein A|nr:AmmeMemoRadiSam system protein A [Terriglobales bacterium]